MKYDVVIVGASFAGLTLAHHLPKDLKVLVLEQKKRLDIGVESTGLITSATRNLFAEFIDVDQFIPNQITTIGVISPDYDKYFFSSTDEPWIYSTDTPKLVDHLANVLPGNIELQKGVSYKRHTIHKGREYPVRITCGQNGEEREIEARFIVGADGGHSKVAAHSPGLSQNKKFLAGLEKVFYGNIHLGDHPDATIYHFWFGEFSLGYGGWLSPTIEQGKPAFRVGLAKLGKDIHKLKKLDEFIDVLLEKGIVTIDGDKKPFFSFGCLIPIGGVLPRLYSDHVMLIGDAGGFCGAFAADGIKGAVVSGKAAAKLIPRHLKGDKTALLGFADEVQKTQKLMTYYKKQVFYRWVWDRMKKDRTFHAMYKVIEREREHFIHQFCDSKDKATSLARVVMKWRNVPYLAYYSLCIFMDFFVKRRDR